MQTTKLPSLQNLINAAALRRSTLPKVQRRVCLRCRIEWQPQCSLCAAWINAKYPTDARLKYADRNRTVLERLI